MQMEGHIGYDFPCPCAVRNGTPKVWTLALHLHSRPPADPQRHFEEGDTPSLTQTFCSYIFAWVGLSTRGLQQLFTFSAKALFLSL